MKRIISFAIIAVMILSTAIVVTSATSKGWFTDVSKKSWYYNSVKYVYDNQLMQGTTDNEFAPEEDFSRAMLVTVLWRKEGSPKASASVFDDVPNGKFYTTAVAWATANGIVKGVGGGKFKPDSPVTREEMTTIFMRYAKFLSIDTSARTDISHFSDVSKISKFAKSSMNWAITLKLVNGVSKTVLNPKGNATRAQSAAMLERFCKEVLVDVENTPTPNPTPTPEPEPEPEPEPKPDPDPIPTPDPDPTPTPDPDYLYSVGVLSDIHIDNSKCVSYKFENALEYFEQYGAKMVCITGDITDNGTEANFGEFLSIRNRYDIPVYATTGNHEASSGRKYKSNITQADCIAYHLYELIGQDFCYYLKGDTYVGLTLSLNPDGSLQFGERVIKTGLNIENDDVYIFVGILGDANYGLFFKEEMQWLKDVLEENRNNRCFIMEHCRAERLKYDSALAKYVKDNYSDYVSGNYGSGYLKSLWGSASNDNQTYARCFEELMSHYTNCIWLHGHTHMSTKTALENGLTPYLYDTYFGNAYNRNRIDASKNNTASTYSIHIPSCAEPRTIDGIDRTGSEGTVIDVYKNKIVLKYIDFITEKIICEIELDTTPDIICENSFDGSTNMVK